MMLYSAMSNDAVEWRFRNFTKYYYYYYWVGNITSAEKLMEIYENKYISTERGSIAFQ